MKGQKKELTENISDTIQDKLRDSVSQISKFKKIIVKIARKLAGKVIKVSAKEEKRLKKSREKAIPVAKTEKKKGEKNKNKTGLKGDVITERESLLIENGKE